MLCRHFLKYRISFNNSTTDFLQKIYEGNSDENNEAVQRSSEKKIRILVKKNLKTILKELLKQSMKDKERDLQPETDSSLAMKHVINEPSKGIRGRIPERNFWKIFLSYPWINFERNTRKV